MPPKKPATATTRRIRLPRGVAAATAASIDLAAPETPSKRRVREAEIANEASPSPRKPILKDPNLETPRRTDRVRFDAADAADAADASPPTVIVNADRSARRKSTRHFVDEEEFDEDSDDDIVKRVYGDEDRDSEESGEKETPAAAAKKRGGKTKTRELSPPLEVLEGPESYFHQNRKARQQTSTSTLASLKQMDHGEYFGLLRKHTPDHIPSREFLQEMHAGDFGQWAFELSQGFNLLLYGYGSKRKLLLSFAEKIYTRPGSVVVVNGYLPGINIKDVLGTVATALLGANHNVKLGASPNDMLDNLLSLLNEPSAQKLTIVFHNLDGEALRQERSQAVISRLAAHPKISLVASIDHIRAPLLWDAARVSQFNFLWHDATTFEPYTVEIPADEALSLVDGAGRAGGTKGVKYVLASLPSNAKSLFRILVSHQLQAMVDDGDARKGKKVDASDYGVEYRVLYQRAVGEFICSNDVAFRTLLKEFMDHQMVTSKKDSQGTEILWAPFRREDLEGILEEIVA
ncbi:origin recognition complex subunit 2-domain-containing protein [Sphaerosporella brunnea]|uniref:Origin recognition complex subunit 2 n=1 Tax=Sphaerosporella brunnea TaxID=1250544 RepID=A0A5J5EEL0_9PEZI|nr:origin recognition complex subunit 2-domain-containing protein [Sphaerosporella brunnea]